MNARDEDLMLGGIASYRLDQAWKAKPKRSPPQYIADDWQDKYDELYRGIEAAGVVWKDIQQPISQGFVK